MLTISDGHVTELSTDPSRPERFHEHDSRSISAVNVALAAKRPLLIRGEPGLGKTQLAEAVAFELSRAFYSLTIDSRTESRDLLWHFDAVLRLADAQIKSDLTRDQARQELAVERYVRPGPLWWGFDWRTAKEAAGEGPTPLTEGHNQQWKDNGWVVLIDEIDKAERDVPNGLLEALGAGQFTPWGREKPVQIQGKPPLVILTTNEERELPGAFLRRCLVLHLWLPKEDRELIQFLIKRGKEHFQDRVSPQALEKAARQLLKDRKSAEQQQLMPLPGQAEYLDLIRAVVELREGDFAGQEELIDRASEFTFQKHREMSHPDSGNLS